MDSPVLDVAIGMVFTFGIVAALSAVLTELVARFLGLRARFLLLGLRELLDGSEVATVQLTRATDSYERFRTLATSSAPQAREAWVENAAEAAPGITDWETWRTHAMGQAKALAPAADGPALAAWATAAAAAAKEEQQRSRPDWNAWANRWAGQLAPSATEAVLGAPIMRSQGMPGTITSRGVVITKDPGTDARQARVELGWKAWVGGNPLRKLPSYIPARTFSGAVLDLVVPTTSGETTPAAIRSDLTTFHEFPALTGPLQSLLKTSEDSVERFREAVERWYDDHMDRVSGWYKRHIAKWSLAFGALLVLLLNVNSITIATTLFHSEEVRTAVAGVAVEAKDCEEKEGGDLTECLEGLQIQLEQATGAGLPIGWRVVPECQGDSRECPFWQDRGILAKGNDLWDWRPVTVLLGWLLTIVALVPGARFWFDLLAKLGSLRSTGPRPQGAGDGQAS